jgi:nucleoprotein TPR
VARLRTENAQLKRGMDDILQEVESRAAEYKQIEKAYEVAMKENTGLLEQLDFAVHGRDTMSKQLNELQVEFRQSEDDNKWLRQTNRDLSLQVRSLLLEIEELNGRLPEDQPNNLFNDGISDAQDLITNRLVATKNIEQLQQRNQELLEIVRKLSDEKEARELEARQSELDDLKQRYAEAMNQLQTLIEERRKNESVIQSIINEREMYRKMAGESPARSRTPVDRLHASSSSPSPFRSSTPLRGGLASSSMMVEQDGNPLVVQFEDLQANYDAYRKEMTENAKMLQEQIFSTQKEMSECRVQLAQARTQSEFLKGM